MTRLVYVTAALALGAVAALGATNAWAVERELVWGRGSGWAALVTLSLALVASPIGALIGRARSCPVNVGPLRRALGITAATLAIAHASVTLTTYLRGAWAHLFDVAWIRSGVLALLILLALLLTSFPRVTRALRVTLWKPLHRLAYVAALFALLHALSSPFAPRRWVLGLIAAVSVIGLARLLPAHRDRA